MGEAKEVHEYRKMMMFRISIIVCGLQHGDGISVGTVRSIRKKERSI